MSIKYGAGNSCTVLCLFDFYSVNFLTAGADDDCIFKYGRGGFNIGAEISRAKHLAVCAVYKEKIANGIANNHIDFSGICVNGGGRTPGVVIHRLFPKNLFGFGVQCDKLSVIGVGGAGNGVQDDILKFCSFFAE